MPNVNISKETYELLKELQKKLPAKPALRRIVEEAVREYEKRWDTAVRRTECE